MPVRELTVDERQQVGAARPLTRDEFARFSRGKSLSDRVISRMLGTDIQEDPVSGRIAPTTAGAITGAMLGARLPIAPGPLGAVINPVTGALVGGAIGVAAGAISPELTMEAGEALGFLPPGTRRKHGLSNEELRTLAEGEALIDLTLGGAMTGLGLARRGAARVLGGVGKEATELADTAARMGVEIPPQMTGASKFSRFFTAVFGRFPLIGGPLRKTGERASRQIEKVLTELPERIGPVFSHSTIGERILRNAQTMVKLIGRRFDKKYTALFNEAADLDVRVNPKAILEKADEILKQISEQTPPTAKEVISGTGKKEGGAGAALDRVKDFIETEIKSLTSVLDDGTRVRPRLTLREMDGLLSKVDQEISSLEPGQKKFAAALLQRLKIAGQKDAIENLSGEGAEAIGRRMRDLDQEFSRTMSALFETSTAQRFERVQRRGLRGMTATKATRTPTDQLSRIIVDLKSPQAIEELSRLVSKRTMRDIASASLDDVLSRGFKTAADGTTVFDPRPVIRELGLDRKASDAFKTMEKLLQKVGGTSIKDVESVLVAAKAIGEMEVPNMSTFIARRATIGGLGSVKRGLAPNAIGGVIGFALTVGGTRAVSKMLADPLAAQSLKIVLSKTVVRSQRRASFLRLTRAVIVSARDENVINIDTAKALTIRAAEFANEMFFPERTQRQPREIK